jgi:hypothetical protein
MKDPTYNTAEINANPIWQLAFSLSEIENDNAPIGWSKYIGTAKCLLDNYDITRKQQPPEIT